MQAETETLEMRIDDYEDSLQELNATLAEVDGDTQRSVSAMIQETTAQMQSCQERLIALRGY